MGQNWHPSKRLQLLRFAASGSRRTLAQRVCECAAWRRSRLHSTEQEDINRETKDSARNSASDNSIVLGLCRFGRKRPPLSNPPPPNPPPSPSFLPHPSTPSPH